MRTLYPVRPPDRSYRFVTFRIINQILNVDHVSLVRFTPLPFILTPSHLPEIAKRLPNDLLEKQPQIEWKQIKGFRDFLAHNYDDVVLKIVWGAIEKLPELENAVGILLSSLDTGTDA